MKLTLRRKIASWGLLAVIVPMVMLSSMHVHESHSSALTECAACVAHHCHGHIAQAALSFDDCVVCQFLSLTFVAAVLAAVAFFFNVLWIHYAQRPGSICKACLGKNITRGPPSV